MAAPPRDDAADFSHLRQLINGYQISQAIHVVAMLGVADILAEGPLEIGSLAGKTSSHAGALYRVMRALAAVGVFAEDDQRRFRLTSVGEGLRSDAPQSQARWARLAASPPMWSAWSGLSRAVADGRPAFQHVHGTDIWTYRDQRPFDRSLFDAAMAEGSRRIARQLRTRSVLTDARHIVDVGGGDGTFLAEILALHPGMTGTTIDLPSAGDASAAFTRAGVGDRASAIIGSFFEDLPRDGDVYILKFILHDWQRTEAMRILDTCRRSMRPSARLLIIERVIAGPNEGADGKFSDLNMLVNPGGEERTETQFIELLAASGWSVAATIELSPGLFAMEARRDDVAIGILV